VTLIGLRAGLYPYRIITTALGIAAYAGRPHHFRCEWNEAADDYADIFIITPIDDETLSLALEQWTKWREWECAFHRGEVSQTTNSALPGMHPR
jgi:hypothetical protein